MRKVQYFDKNLEFFFQGTPFEIAQDLEGEVFRQYENRITKKFKVDRKSYFLKFHGAVGWKEIFKNFLQFKVPVIGAQREYDALIHLSRNNIKCPSIKGFGLKGFNPANSSSFLVTEELYDTLSLEDFFLQGLHKNISFLDKKKLIEKVARLIRAMHDSGLNHRDLYLCHIHINKKINFDDIDIHLIDLHRAQVRSQVPLRWLIKDLGGFMHSAIQFKLTERDFYRFMMEYFKCSFNELDKIHRNIIKKILKRAFTMYLKPQLKGSSLRNLKNTDNDHFLAFNEHSLSYLVNKDQEDQKEEILKFLHDENYLINTGTVIKNEEGHLVVKVKIYENYYFIKKYRIKGFWHGLSRLFRPTRAFNAWRATLWLNAVGIKTAEPILLCEETGILGAKNSHFVSKSIAGQSLDSAIIEGQDSIFIVSIIEAFFKRMSWIDFEHGDAKTSNFFVNKNLIAFDLDSANKSSQRFISRNSLSRDKTRMLKSLKGYNAIFSRLSERLNRS